MRVWSGLKWHGDMVQRRAHVKYLLNDCILHGAGYETVITAEHVVHREAIVQQFSPRHCFAQ
jgi:hypothetical protein